MDQAREVVEAPTLAELLSKDTLSSGGLDVGGTYTVLMASFGQNDGYQGIADRNRAFLVLRQIPSGRLWLIRPSLYSAPGADGGPTAESPPAARDTANTHRRRSQSEP